MLYELDRRPASGKKMSAREAEARWELALQCVAPIDLPANWGSICKELMGPDDWSALTEFFQSERRYRGRLGGQK